MCCSQEHAQHQTSTPSTLPHLTSSLQALCRQGLRCLANLHHQPLLLLLPTAAPLITATSTLALDPGRPVAIGVSEIASESAGLALRQTAVDQVVTVAVVVSLDRLGLVVVAMSAVVVGGCVPMPGGVAVASTAAAVAYGG